MPRRAKTTSGATCSASSDDPGGRAVRFLNNLTHTGDYAGVPFRLRPWQEPLICKLFGTLRPDGTRRYRKVFMALPRKQGKTELVAGVGLYLLLGQGKPNQRIYTAASDSEQAGYIFNAACEMIRQEPELDSRLVIYSGYKRIDYPAGNSSLKVLSSVPKSKHGLGPTAVLIDELHVVGEALVNVLTTGFAARRDPLTFMITTAGWDRHSICYDEWEYARKVANGVVDNPAYLPLIFAADPEDDWTDERVWHKAMPALGDFCSLEIIRDEFKKAIERPRFENTFKNLYLNLWTEQAVRWMSLDRWDLCNQLADPASLAGRACYGGLDLSLTRDLSALELVFPDDDGGYDVVSRFWAPEEGVWRDDQRHKELYLLWARQGHLILTPGETIDYTFIEAEIVRLAAEYDLRRLLVDKAFANHLCLRLRDLHGIPADFLSQTSLSLNAPTLELERLVIDRKLRHGGHPVLRWCASNVAVRTNATGLIQLDKAESTGRIDGMAALVNALAGAIGAAADDGPSVYEGRGVLAL